MLLFFKLDCADMVEFSLKESAFFLRLCYSNKSCYLVIIRGYLLRRIVPKIRRCCSFEFEKWKGRSDIDGK